MLLKGESLMVLEVKSQPWKEVYFFLYESGQNHVGVGLLHLSLLMKGLPGSNTSGVPNPCCV